MLSAVILVLQSLLGHLCRFLLFCTCDSQITRCHSCFRSYLAFACAAVIALGTAAASVSPWPRTVEAFNLLISLRSSNCLAFFTLCRSMFKEFAGLMQTRTAHQQIGACHVPCATRQSGDAQKEPFSCSCNKNWSRRQKIWRPLQLTCLAGPSSFYLAPAMICKVSQKNTGYGAYRVNRNDLSLPANVFRAFCACVHHYAPFDSMLYANVVVTDLV